MPRPRTSRRTVGLDIEPSYLAAAEVTVNGSLAVERAASMPLEPGLMREGEVIDPDALGDALREFFRQHGFGKRVRLGVANQRIVVRTLDLPPLTDRKELEAAVRFQAQEHIPMPLEQAVLDFQLLDLVQTEQGQRQRALVVAARRDQIERLLAAVRRAGLRPDGIDLSAFAMIRALETASAEGAVLYVNAGSLTNIAVARAGVCHFTRVASGGIDGMVAELAERRGLTLDHAAGWLPHVGLVDPVEEIEGEEEIVADTRAVLADGVRRIADEIRNSLDFYRAQQGSLQVERALLTGPAVAVPGFVDHLASELALPVEPGLVAAAPGVLDDLERGRMTIAAGLAVEERAA